MDEVVDLRAHPRRRLVAASPPGLAAEAPGEERCAPRDDGVMGFKEAITYFGALGHATECRVEAETVALRAYVTSGCPLVTTRAMRMRARKDLTPRRAAGLWPAHERRERLA